MIHYLYSHLIEQTWELMHQGQDVNPTDGFLDSVNEYLNLILIPFKFYIYMKYLSMVHHVLANGG